MATQTILLSKNKLQYKEDAADFVKFDFTQNQITATAPILSATGMLTVAGASNLSDKLTVSAGGMDVAGASTLNGALTVTNGGMDVTGTSYITGNTVIDGTLTVSKIVDLQNDMQVQGNSDLGFTKVRNTLTVANTGSLVANGSSTFNGTLTANGVTTINSTLNVTGASELKGGLTVTGGGTSLSGLLVVGGATLSSLQVNSSSNLGDLSAATTTLGASTLESLAVTNASTLSSLTIFNDASVQGNSSISKNLAVSLTSNLNVLNANASILKSLEVTDDSKLKGALEVTGASELKGGLTVTGGGTSLSGLLVVGGATLSSLQVNSSSNLGDLSAATTTLGASTLESLAVTNTSNLHALNVIDNAAANLTGTLTVGGKSNLNGGLDVTGDASVTGKLNVTATSGLSSIKHDFQVDGASTLKSLTVTDNLTLTGALEAGASKLASLEVTGASALKGGLGVTGLSTFSDKLTVNSGGMALTLGNLDVTAGNMVLAAGNMVVSQGQLTVSAGKTTVQALDVNGATNIYGPLEATGSASFQTLTVNQPNGATLNGAVFSLNSILDATTSAAANLNVLNANESTLKSLEVTNASKLKGALEVTGASELKGGLSVTGSTSLAGVNVANTAIISILEVTGASTLSGLSAGTTSLGASTLNSLAVTNASNLDILNANASILKSLEVTNASTLKGALDVSGGMATFNAGATVDNGLTVIGGVNIINGGLEVPIGHAARLQGTLFVGTETHPQNSTLKGELDVSGLAKLGGLEVTGQSTLGVLVANDDSVFHKNLNVKGLSTLDDKLTISANGMDVTGASTVRGDLSATGATDLRSTLHVVGTSTLGVLIGGESSLGATTLHSLEVTNASNLKGNLNVGTDGAPVISNLFGDVTIKGNFNVIGTGKKTTLNQEELTVQDPTITIGNNNPADTVPMSLSMAYKTGDSAFTAGLRRKANNGGFLLFKNCVNHDDAKEEVIYDSLTVHTLECFSDMNLKKNIVTIDGALDKLDGIRGVYHDWINTKQSEDRQIGVIAQEVQAVYPELVHENENGYLSVNYPKLTAVLLQSIKELKAMVLAICAKQA